MAILDQRKNPRASALVGRIARLEPDTGRLDAVALGLVDAVLETDNETVGAALDALRDARARADDRHLLGWLDAAIAFAHWALERAPSGSDVTQGTHAQEFLSALAAAPRLGSAELRLLLGTDETQISRTGRRLLDSGLVTRTKVGREVFWQVTPRGKHALAQMPETPPPDSSSFWSEAMRRGFDGTPSEGDPIRERIVGATLKLHQSKGIQATTWQEIAAGADVPVDSVEAAFPTLDDLVRACGAHFLESIRIPPPERAADVYVGTSAEPERIRRLVETSFGVYERGADGIAVAQRERIQVPTAGEPVDHIAASLDALVAEALRPWRSDRASKASVRALTDIEVWRTLRDQGATPDAAVEQAGATLERWLEAHPAR
jgi:AcrR family transcriptional regulator